MRGMERALLPARPELTPARRRLFETALRLFGERGYHGVSVRDIVGELDQHPTAIYAHVSSKQDLLFALVRIAHEELRDRVRLALLEAGTAASAQLRAIVMANALTHLELPELAQITASEVRHLSDEQRAVLDVLRNDLGALLRDVVERGIAQGAFTPADPVVALYAITTMGVHVHDWWTPAKGSPHQVATAQADLALRIMGVEG